jgi:site-specific DNA-methyltransferase (adenine-specific)
MADYLLIHGDSRRLPVDLASVDAVVSDPPYGINYRHGGGGKGLHTGRNAGMSIFGDDEPFDPAAWIQKPCLLFGAHHYASRIPAGGSWLAWDKAPNGGPPDQFTDCDFAWTSVRGIKRNIFRYTWKGLVSTKGADNNGIGSVDRHHPSQKPIALMRWCIRLMKLPPNSLILDPFMGSSTTIIAALAEGHRAIGIEIDRRYCDIARHRIERPHARIPRDRGEPLPLFANTNGDDA